VEFRLVQIQLCIIVVLFRVLTSATHIDDFLEVESATAVLDEVSSGYKAIFQSYPSYHQCHVAARPPMQNTLFCRGILTCLYKHQNNFWKGCLWQLVWYLQHVMLFHH